MKVDYTFPPVIKHTVFVEGFPPFTMYEGIELGIPPVIVDNE